VEGAEWNAGGDAGVPWNEGDDGWNVDAGGRGEKLRAPGSPANG
jgi:hypothetical protein